MNTPTFAQPVKNPGNAFLRHHLWWPLAVAITLIGIAEFTPLDRWVADAWFAAEGGGWSLQDHWLTYDVIHHHGKQLVIAFGLCMLVLLGLSFRLAELRPWRSALAYLCTALVLLPVAIAEAKQLSPNFCPWDMIRYGGDIPMIEHFTRDSALGLGHCFPSGHASGGFALLALYFAAWPFARKPAWFLLPGVLVGTVFALGQQARGAHFISHDLWTISICWFGALGLFLLWRPWRYQGMKP